MSVMSTLIKLPSQGNIERDNNDITLLLVYVVDMIVTCNTNEKESDAIALAPTLVFFSLLLLYVFPCYLVLCSYFVIMCEMTLRLLCFPYINLTPPTIRIFCIIIFIISFLRHDFP